jgi:hypothetical protein
LIYTPHSTSQHGPCRLRHDGDDDTSFLQLQREFRSGNERLLSGFGTIGGGLESVRGRLQKVRFWPNDIPQQGTEIAAKKRPHQKAMMEASKNAELAMEKKVAKEDAALRKVVARQLAADKLQKLANRSSWSRAKRDAEKRAAAVSDATAKVSAKDLANKRRLAQTDVKMAAAAEADAEREAVRCGFGCIAEVRPLKDASALKKVADEFASKRMVLGTAKGTGTSQAAKKLTYVFPIGAADEAAIDRPLPWTVLNNMTAADEAFNDKRAAFDNAWGVNDNMDAMEKDSADKVTIMNSSVLKDAVDKLAVDRADFHRISDSSNSVKTQQLKKAALYGDALATEEEQDEQDEEEWYWLDSFE